VVDGLLVAPRVAHQLSRPRHRLHPLLSRELSPGPGTKGLLLSSFLFYAAIQILIGWCADRLNLRWLDAGHSLCDRSPKGWRDCLPVWARRLPGFFVLACIMSKIGPDIQFDREGALA
jgi:hypothetical protein